MKRNGNALFYENFCAKRLESKIPYKYRTEMAKKNFRRVCRACLSDRGNLRYIFATRIPRMMETCADIQVSEEDGLSPYVCVTCFYFLAKFCTFKKKIEQSDQFLRNYMKQSTHKQKDILDIAVSEAQIEQGNNEEIEFAEKVDPSSEEYGEKQLTRRKRSSKQKAKVNIAGVKKSAISGTHLEIDNRDYEHTIVEIIDANSQAFMQEPPPLVPLEIALESTKTLDVPERNSDEFNIPLAAKPPPLIPIKPVVTDDKILANLIEITEFELNLTCNSCSQKFVSILELKEHKLTTCKDKSLRCTICRKEFKDRQRLIRHLKGHTVQKDYKCKICNKCYPNPSTFRVHMRTHTGERPFRCETCNKGFMRWAGVAMHMRTHQVQKPYTCENCGRGFKIASNLERHRVLHAESLPYCCNYCGKTFSQADNMQLHIRSYHTNERPFLCNECGKGFVSSNRLNRHMWIHTGYKPYKCKSCTKAYTNSSDLKNHERIHQGGAEAGEKPYACQICKMSFYHSCRLTKHLKIHEKPFPCNVCPKTFSTSELLYKHMNSKTNMHPCPNYGGTEEGEILGVPPDDGVNDEQIVVVRCDIDKDKMETPS